MKNYFWDMFTSIRNGQLAKKETILLSRQIICENFLQILWDEGYILGYKIEKTNKLKVFLKYTRTGMPVISVLKSISKPSQRVYCTAKQIWKLDLNKTLVIFSTSKGLKSAQQCKQQKIGGELFVLIN